ncbi:hypothetical protein HDU99_007502 [Rhizoclosmatium hyalinum]|nr:hypothetical protein HDU99_007502 [Rhizoclosmatium hyalinum]
MAFGSFFSKGKQPDVNRKATTVHKVDPEHVHASIEIQQQTKQHLVARLRKLQDVRNDLEAVENELFVFKLQLMRFLDNVFDNATLFDLDDPRFEDHASVMASLTDSEALILEMIHTIENLQRSSELLADAESCIREAKDQLGHISQFEVRFSLGSTYNLPAVHFSGASSKMDMAVYKLETARNVWNDVPPILEFPGVVFGNASVKDATRLQTQLAESRVKIQAYIAMAQSQIADHQLSLSGAKESRLENAVKLYTLRIEIMEDLMQENGMTVPGMYTGVKPQDLLGSMFTPTTSSVDVPVSTEGGGILTSSFFAKLYAPTPTQS